MILRSLLIAALAVLAARLWSLQIARWSTFDRAAEGNQTQTVWTPAPRGTICDRTGTVVLADSRIVYQTQVTPSELPTDAEQRDAAVVTVATALGASTVEVERALKRAIGDAQKVLAPSAILPDIGENITQLQAIRLDVRRGETPGIRVVETAQRYYPHGTLAAHVTGYARAIAAEEYADLKDLVWPGPPPGLKCDLPIDLAEQKVYDADSTIGKTGVEKLCDRVRIGSLTVPALQGRRGADEFEVDAYGSQRLVARVPPIRGATVYLTLDARIQKAAEAALAHPDPYGEKVPPEGAAAVAVDVRTGEILAMASYPAIDQNLYVRGFADPEQYRKMLDSMHNPELNRAIGGSYPTGSTFKMISGCAILETTPANLGTTYRCTGRIIVGARKEPKRCWQRAGHGYVDFDRAVAESCDVYFWEAVRQAGLTSDNIADYARRFGLGELTGCGLPSEAEGLVPTAQWKREAKDERWLQGDTINLVIGQGFLRVTPLQMARAAAAVANGGMLLPLRIVRKIVWPREAGVRPVLWEAAKPRPVGVKPSTLQAIRAGMRRGVVDRKGTSHWPMQGLPVSVAAKTGSAETGTLRDAHSWFICFAPYENPRIAVAVIVEYGGHGSEVAGYVARRMLQAAFAPAPQVTASGGGPQG
jgi:penicillin-binding protein 2